ALFQNWLKHDVALELDQTVVCFEWSGTDTLRCLNLMLLPQPPGHGVRPVAGRAGSARRTTKRVGKEPHTQSNPLILGGGVQELFASAPRNEREIVVGRHRGEIGYVVCDQKPGPTPTFVLVMKTLHQRFHVEMRETMKRRLEDSRPDKLTIHWQE